MFTTSVSLLLCTGWRWELNHTHYGSQVPPPAYTATRRTSNMVCRQWT